MKNEFIPYEQALALKELGFDEPCFGRYIYDGRGKEWFLVQTQQTKSASVIFEGARSVDGISVAAPLYQQAFRWFIEKHFKMAYIYYDVEYKFCFCIGYNDKTKGFKSYEKAELACLKKLIEIVKSKNNTP